MDIDTSSVAGGATRKPQRESDLLHAILVEFGSRPDLRIWRANVIAARSRTGQVIRAGVPGQADISGILWPNGRRIEIETKSRKGKQREAQRRWQEMIEKMGGLYILARTLDDVRLALPKP